MRKVMCFGTFDIIHPGHYYYLNRAKELGDHLIVVVARDKNVVKAKGRKPVNNEEERLRCVKKTGIPDEAVLGGENDPFAVIVEKKPSIIAMGYDQKPNEEILKKVLQRKGVEVEIVRIGAFKQDIYKSSKLRQD